ncbi:hypothetical protein ACROYT_G003618 [Oculina patagonica]
MPVWHIGQQITYYLVLSEKRGIRKTEKRIGGRQLPVDGFHKESQTVFQFHGCNWHGHQCHLTHGKEMNEKQEKSMAELYDGKKANTKYIKDQGYWVVNLWECQWLQMKNTNKDLQRFIATKLGRPFDRVHSPSQEQILEAVMKIFGCVLCDIEVPDSPKEYYATQYRCFEPFGNAVSDARRAGDVEPSKAIIADTMKLVGNSSYARTITNKERHREVRFCSEASVHQLNNSPFFRDRIL